MRRVVVIAALAIAGFAPLLRYQPENTAAPESAVTAAPPASGAGSPPAAGSPPDGGGPRTVEGSVVPTEFGPYQVQVAFTGSAVTDVRLITEPSDGHSRRIANRAAPTLRSEALQAQSAHIDTVSGATATSEAYAESLQAALDARGR